jgi:hypothetical protein
MLRPIPVLPAGANAKALAFLKKTGLSVPAWSVSLGSVEPAMTARELAPYCAVFAPLEMENGSPDMKLLYPCSSLPAQPAPCGSPISSMVCLAERQFVNQVTMATWVWSKSARPRSKRRLLLSTAELVVGP